MAHTRLQLGSRPVPPLPPSEITIQDPLRFSRDCSRVVCRVVPPFNRVRLLAAPPRPAWCMHLFDVFCRSAALGSAPLTHQRDEVDG